MESLILIRQNCCEIRCSETLTVAGIKALSLMFPQGDNSLASLIWTKALPFELDRTH